MAVASTSGIWLYKSNALDQPGQLLQGYDTTYDVMLKVLFSPKGDLIASSSDTTIVLWEVQSATAKSEFSESPAQHGYYALAFSPDETTLAAASGSTIDVWDVASGKKRFFWQNRAIQVSSPDTPQEINAIAYSPRGNSLATGDSDNNIRLWDIQSGTLQGTFTSPPSSTTPYRQFLHSDSGLAIYGITSLAFSPDGKLLVSGSADNYVRIWNVDGRYQRTSRADEVLGVSSVAFSADGNAVAYLGVTAWFWQFESGKDPAFLPKDIYWQSLVFNLDGSPLALGLKNDSWVMWSPNPGQYKTVFNAPGTPNCCNGTGK